MKKDDSLLASTLKTLSYSQIFSFPLTKKELFARLITPPFLSFAAFSRKLAFFVREKKVAFSQKYYFLPGKKETVVQRKKLALNWKPKYQLAKKAAGFLAKIPSVWFVGLSGNLALGVAKKTDDLDLMIITAPNSLWLTRLKIYLLLKRKGAKENLFLRQPGEKKAKNKLCLNLFLDGADLSLRPKQQNLFSAYQIALLKPLFNKKQIYERFLAANRWVLNYLPLAFKAKNYPSCPKKFNFLNRIAYFGQKVYMKPRQKKERICLTQAFFHPHNKAKEILSKFSS